MRTARLIEAYCRFLFASFFVYRNMGHGEALPVYYCNSSFLSSTGLGMADGMYLFESSYTYTFVGARDACKSWPFPAFPQNVTFITSDVMISAPSSIQPSLANLWNPANFNVWLKFLNYTSNEYWIGLGQNVNVATCPSSSISSVYEESWNWTWVDGTPLIRDTKGQGIVFFANDEPSNLGNSEHYGSSWNWLGVRGLNDMGCSASLKALCSLPRNKFVLRELLIFCSQLMR
jgi:hypothetical protein